MTRGSDLRLIQELLASLDVGREQYRVLSSAECERAVAWLKDHFPIALWGRVIWSEVPDSTCVAWSNFEERASLFAQLCERLDLDNPQVTVMWSNALRPCIEIALEGARRNAEQIFDADFDTWILCPIDGWCIELYHEGELCFGRIPSTRRVSQA